MLETIDLGTSRVSLALQLGNCMENVSLYSKYLPKAGMKLPGGIAPVLEGYCGSKVWEKKNPKERGRLDRNRCWAVISITKDAKTLQKLFKCELALDLEFFHLKKSETDAFNEGASNSLGFSYKSVAMTIAGQRKCQSNLTVVNSEEHKSKCSVMFHQITFSALNDLQFPWIKWEYDSSWLKPGSLSSVSCPILVTKQMRSA